MSYTKFGPEQKQNKIRGFHAQISWILKFIGNRILFADKYLKRHVLRHHPKVLSWNDIQSRLINKYKIFVYYFKFSESWWFFDLGYKLIRKLDNHDRFTLYYANISPTKYLQHLEETNLSYIFFQKNHKRSMKKHNFGKT